VAEIMTPHVLCVRAELGAEAAGRVLLEKGLGGAPVVDAMGRPIGIVSRTDVLRWATQERTSLPAATVADVMTPVTFSLPANESVAKAAALMVFEHVHRLPVLAPSGEVIGIVSSHDVMRWLARSSGYVVDGLVYPRGQ
jgi:CBS domain-containing protein